MKERMPFAMPIVGGLVLLALVLFVLPDSLFSGFGINRHAGGVSESERVAGSIKTEDETGSGLATFDPLAAQWAALMARLGSKNARPNETLLSFDSAEAMKAFLDRADEAGLKILGKIDALNMVRVGYDDLNDLRDDMRAHPGDYAGAGPNYLVQIPTVPSLENRPEQREVGFDDGALAFMGVKGDISTWGKGVTIAILDTGVTAHPAFTNGRVTSIDIGMGLTGTSDADGHGTAVASLAGGGMTGAAGVAPAANLLSIRVTDSDGVSDLFTLAQGIQTAVDAGAKVINISLGAYNDSSVLSRMIDYADRHGSIIVAAAGNDQSSTMTWPAANPLVISVGAVDAVGQQVSFSNSGENLSATAPGLGLNAAWPGGQIVSFDGTSGSAPLMSGAIASMLSLNPKLTARQAASLVTTYSADAGAPGPDPRYGNGTVDIGYALNFGNTAYLDPSISSQYFHPDENSMEFVVQNRSGSGVSSLTLDINAAGVSQSIAVPFLQAGERWSYTVPIDQARLTTETQLQYSSRLRLPAGLTDVNPGNNGKMSVVFKPTVAAP